MLDFHQFDAILKGTTSGLITLGVVAGGLGELGRRVNRTFEGHKEIIAAQLKDPTVPWKFYRSSLVQRFPLIVRAVGVGPTCRMLLQNATAACCRDWDGADTRRKQGTPRDRAPGQPNPLVIRRSDYAEYFVSLCQCIDSSKQN
jgi:hypothetical protein